MQLRAVASLTEYKKIYAAGPPPAQESLKQGPQEAAPAAGTGGEQKLRGAFGRLTPVHAAMHSKLTKGGYKHDANYVTQSGQGQFGYYSNPASGHKVILDDRGNVQDQQPMPQGKGGGNKMQFGGPGSGRHPGGGACPGGSCNKHPVEARGNKGMDNKPFTRQFKSSDHLNDWADKNSADVHEIRSLGNEEIPEQWKSAGYHAEPK